MRRFAPITVATFVLGMLSLPAHAQFIYGITTNGRIYEIDISNATTTAVLFTNINNTNGLAFDNSTNRLFFRSGSDGNNTGNGNIYVWNRQGVAIQVTVPTNIVASGILPNAATGGSFYNGAYWYVGHNTDTLYRVDFDFTIPSAPRVSALTAYANFDAPNTATAFTFNGDISIRPDGTLYGSGNRNGTGAGQKFFRVNISGGSPTGYTENTQSTPLQLGFSSDGSTLYGHNANVGTWFTVNIVNGATTSLSFSSPVTFLDLSEGSATSAIPEPGVWVTGGVFGAGLIGMILRRRTKK